jgi:hypothetical protein
VAARLTVFSIIRNGIQNGYPFVEAYGSWLAYCDRLFVLEGCSTDGTDFALNELAGFSPKVTVVSRPWPRQSEGGSAIAEFTNTALSLAATGSDMLMYIQADEIYTPAQRASVRDWQGGPVEFAGYVNFWNALDRVLTNDFGWRNLKLFPASAGARSIGDGYSFEAPGAPITRRDDRILHYGWCFPVNILQKHISHALLYPDDPQYRLRGLLAGLMLRQGSYDRRLLDALAPQYHPQPFPGPHPECMLHLLDLDVYDPYVGVDLLAGGARW